jgi:hypothetical protein
MVLKRGAEHEVEAEDTRLKQMAYQGRVAHAFSRPSADALSRPGSDRSNSTSTNP